MPVRLVFRYLGEHWRLFLVALLTRGVYELLPMQIPVLTGALVDVLSGESGSVYGFEIRRSAESFLTLSVIAFAVISVSYGLSSYASKMSGSHLGRQATTGMRDRLTRHLLGLSLDHHQELGAGALIDRTLSDPNKLRSFIKKVFIQTFTNAIRIGYPLVMLLTIDVRLTLYALAPMPFLIAITWWLQHKLHADTRTALDSYSDLTQTINEQWNGIETIKTLHAEAIAATMLADENEQQEGNRITTDRWKALTQAATWFLTTVGLGLTWWLGGGQVLNGTMTVGALVTYTGFVDFIYRPIRRFTGILGTYRKGIVAIERMDELLQLESAVADRDDPQTLEIENGHVRLHNVDFSYKDEPVLNGLSLEIPAQKMTAIVGPSGSGKSTVLRLIPRLYAPDNGHVTIDGQKLKAQKLDTIRSNIAVVPQDPVLFSGTLRDNLTLGNRDADDDMLRRVCEQARLTKYIDSLENGLDTRVGRGGNHLSGGQLQRLAIARALLRQPGILLMDEPTSALDSDAEQAVVEVLESLRGEMTLVIVTHRMSTIENADHVIVIEDGTMSAEGTHDELRQDSDLYRETFDLEPA